MALQVLTTFAVDLTRGTVAELLTYVVVGAGLIGIGFLRLERHQGRRAASRFSHVNKVGGVR